MIDKIFKLINKFFLFIKDFYKCDSGIIEKIKQKKAIIHNILNPVNNLNTKSVKHILPIELKDIQVCYNQEDYEYLVFDNGFKIFGFYMKMKKLHLNGYSKTN